MAKSKDDKIIDSVNRIRDEADNIEETVEDKRVKTHGDPIVEMY